MSAKQLSGNGRLAVLKAKPVIVLVQHYIRTESLYHIQRAAIYQNNSELGHIDDLNRIIHKEDVVFLDCEGVQTLFTEVSKSSGQNYKRSKYFWKVGSGGVFALSHVNTPKGCVLCCSFSTSGLHIKEGVDRFRGIPLPISQDITFNMLVGID